MLLLLCDCYRCRVIAPTLWPCTALAGSVVLALVLKLMSEAQGL